MSIRTEDEYRAALARLDAERVILASRSFTDDEQRDFEALVRDIETYKAGGSPSASTAPALPPSPASPVMPPVACPTPTVSFDPFAVSHASVPDTLLVDGMRARVAASASMQRELARQGLAAASSPRIDLGQAGTASASRANMERVIHRAGMTPVR